MAEVQTTYTDNMAPAYAGMIANGEVGNRITRTCEDSAGIGFGKAAFRGVGDHGCTGVQALTGAGSANAGNVGTGTITASPTISAGARIGRYAVTLLATSATGALQVVDPIGNVVAKGNVGTAITTVPGIASFTVSNAGTMTVGDQWYIDVTGNDLLGVTIAHEALALLPGADVDEYPRYENVPILTGGTPIWVKAGGNVADGNDVYIDSNGDFVASGGIPARGWKFDTTGVDDDLVKIVKRI